MSDEKPKKPYKPRKSKYPPLKPGDKFEMLTVDSEEFHENGRRRVYCVCSCPDQGRIKVPTYALRGGNTGSCGCRKREAGKRNKTHGNAPVGKPTPEYTAWANMIQRCTNPNLAQFKDYGGRNIRICKRWRQFENFLADLGPKPNPKLMLERRNSNKNYTPSNCYWADRTVQNNNTRRNKFLTLKGEKLTVSQWARKIGIHPATLWDRLKRGWAVKKALTTPIHPSYAGGGKRKYPKEKPK